MSAGKCNLLLIKTCCWLGLQTDSNSKLSGAQFSPSPLSSYFPRSLHLWPHLSLLSQCSVCSLRPKLLCSLSSFIPSLLPLPLLSFAAFPPFLLTQSQLSFSPPRLGAYRRVARSSWMKSITRKWDAPSGTSYIIDSL